MTGKINILPSPPKKTPSETNATGKWVYSQKNKIINISVKSLQAESKSTEKCTLKTGFSKLMKVENIIKVV